jgi:hypothetical protein
MRREAIAAKAHRLLAEHRLRVTRLDGVHVQADVIGDHGDYQLQHLNGVWTCTCPARKRCAHLYALELIATPRTATTTGDCEAVASDRHPQEPSLHVGGDEVRHHPASQTSTG